MAIGEVMTILIAFMGVIAPACSNVFEHGRYMKIVLVKFAVSTAFMCVCTLRVASSNQGLVGGSQAGSIKMPITADPSFEVATVRLSPSGGEYPLINTHSRSFSAINASVVDLIKWSYQLRDEQIRNAPAWTSELKFDIVGQPDLAGQPSRDQDRSMVRKLLADRFHLVVQETEQTASVYALERGNGPLRMIPSSRAEGHVTIKRRALENDMTRVEFEFATMPDFMYVLMNTLPDHQIVDETGLKGEYDFVLTLPSEALEGSVEPGQVSASFFRAIESIGLRIERKKSLVRAMVIDHIEKPTDN